MPFRERWFELTAIIAGALLLLGVYIVLKPFLISILWAVVIASTTWPVYGKIRKLFKGKDSLSSLIMLCGVIVLLILPVTLIAIAAKDEAAKAYIEIKPLIEGQTSFKEYPQLENFAAWLKEKIPVKEDAIEKVFLEGGSLISTRIIEAAHNILRNAFKMVITLFLVFFMYRDGEKFLAFVKNALPMTKNYRVDIILHIRDVVKAVVYGIIITAMTQGFVAGIGYWFLGFSSPILMGIATAALAIIPFGAGIIWLPAALMLFIEGSFVKAVVLIIWGAAVVGTIDNVIRPLVISASAKISALLVFLGVLGGVMAFGMIGLFIGPIILSVALTLVKEYVKETKTKLSKD